MTLIGVLFFGLGFAASYVIGRRIGKYGDIAQGLSIALCGVGGLLFGMPAVLHDGLLLTLVVLGAYGMIGALLFRAGRRARKEQT
ncbi:hypothetical protein Dshi_0374 [Dinoroseobacter shibae DFL 12 = DSM 16493]|jgi:steroid 5-alpha reductase family enzyme|uniref:Uncharacterized protein n=1 Tax=Dinoroseobacter shibae (strain DSM 16493 / NCIMB 14021 / DFL 12) TaxID=398580 RepID=A8LMX9_DINSH|nr:MULTISPECIES: hypothetical protein [Dinoroseobacter]ABV92123.1 hypothetical protein Dshi_0374 [Dinoroseobacter shibae DFL 12 = DSM 16493]MDD9718917.1 hypothetical protein [Dinoroseobacter sp. PD6]URF47081.1 hypothetical protein M8008_01905 [Dinoroseobacter shibae]URF51392.1 hypothetical protein M8007_01905 [Dinoroseobacter shibae]